MNKPTKKTTKKRRTYNVDVIKALSDEFEVSTQFVRQCVRKEKHSRTAMTIEKKYHEMASASLRAIEEFKKSTI